MTSLLKKKSEFNSFEFMRNCVFVAYKAKNKCSKTAVTSQSCQFALLFTRSTMFFEAVLKSAFGFSHVLFVRVSFSQWMISKCIRSFYS